MVGGRSCLQTARDIAAKLEGVWPGVGCVFASQNVVGRLDDRALV